MCPCLIMTGDRGPVWAGTTGDGGAPGTISSCSLICHPSLHLPRPRPGWRSANHDLGLAPLQQPSTATTAGHQHHLARLPGTWDSWVRASHPGWALNAGPRTLRPGHGAEAGAGAGVAALLPGQVAAAGWRWRPARILTQGCAGQTLSHFYIYTSVDTVDMAAGSLKKSQTKMRKYFL